jgi:purine nucleosidase
MRRSRLSTLRCAILSSKRRATDYRRQSVHSGAEAPAALRRGLEQGPLAVLALGPLTNIAAALRDRPDLAARVERLVVVMGRREGHLFHPSEGRGDGMLFGHGPVFRDFNYVQDRRAADEVLRLGAPLTMVPYEAARQVTLKRADLDSLAADGRAPAWVASRARGWQQYWQDDIGLDGFYPFDLVAAAGLLEPRFFECAAVRAWISPPPALAGWARATRCS